MSDQAPQHIPNESSREIRIFAVVLSTLAHIIFLYLPLPNINSMLSIRTPGIQGGSKGHLLLIRKSEIRGNSNSLSAIDEKFGLTLEKLQIKNRSPKKLNNNFFFPSSEHLKPNQMSSSRQPSILSHKVQGKDVALPHGARFSEKSRHAFDGSLFDVGLELPEGIGEDQLNRMEEVFYSFRKRTFEQFINQFLFLTTTMNSTYPLSSFPWTTKHQVLRARLTYDKEGNLQRIMHLQKSDVAILQDFYQKILDGMSKLPNPPRASLKENGTFELTIGITILE